MKSKRNTVSSKTTPLTNVPSNKPFKTPVPKKHKRDKKARCFPVVGQRWQTKLAPPPLQKSIPLKGIVYDRKEVPKNVNIQQQLGMNFHGKDLSHAKVLLNHLERSGIVEWDEYGDLFKPVNGYNVIDFLSDVILFNKLGPDKLNDYSFIIQTANIPLHFIRNTSLKNYMIQSRSTRTITSSKRTLSSGVGKKKKGKFVKKQHISPEWKTF